MDSLSISDYNNWDYKENKGQSDPSEQTEQEGNYDEYEDYENEERNHPFPIKRQIRLGDIILMQFILCVLIVLALVACNYIKHDLSSEILNNCKIEINKPFEYKQEIAEIFSKLSKLINVKI